MARRGVAISFGRLTIFCLTIFIPFVSPKTKDVLRQEQL